MTTPLAGLLAAATLATYLFLYTPLKRLTPFATIIGAVPGALPPVIGWAAARGEIGLPGWALFAILFFWQMPHFLSLSWLYRRDYGNAGYRLLSVVDESGVIVRRQILIFSFTLIPATLLPAYTNTLGPIYFLGALLLSSAFMFTAFRCMRPLTNASARVLFLASLFYLPALICLMAIDKV
jgi:protoheme IX farnesyltransferase